MIYEYEMPRNIKNRAGIYQFMCILYKTYSNVKDSTIYLNFKSTNWIDPNLTAILGLILEKFKEKGNLIFLRNLKSPILKLFVNINFVKLSNISTQKAIPFNSIPYNSFSGDDIDSFRSYIDDQLENLNLDYSKISIISTRLKEIFINVKMHARLSVDNNQFNNNEIFCAGYYNLKDKLLYFSVCNQGLTFKQNIYSNKRFTANTECDYINWATKKSSSTRVTPPGGFGLHLLKEIIELLEGELIILSGKGYYQSDTTRLLLLDFETLFPGTVVSFKIPVDNMDNLDNFSIDENKIFTIDDFIGGL